MEYTIEMIEEAEKYLYGNISPSERVSFENRLKEDFVLKNLLTDLETSRKIIEESLLQQQARQFLTSLDEKNNNQKARKIWLNTVFKIAASVLLLLGSIWLYTDVKLANSDFNIGVVKGLHDNLSGLTEEEQKAFDSYVNGNNYFVNGDFIHAATSFEEVQHFATSNYLLESTEWNLAITYLKLNDNAKAYIHYQKISENQNRHFEISTLDIFKLGMKIRWLSIFS